MGGGLQSLRSGKHTSATDNTGAGVERMSVVTMLPRQAQAVGGVKSGLVLAV